MKYSENILALRSRFVLSTRLALLGAILFGTCSLSSQTTIIDPTGDGGFSNGNTFASNGWTAVNGAETDNWLVGTRPPGNATNSAHVHDGGGGPSQGYSSDAAIIHFYRDVTFPAGEIDIFLQFDWQCVGDPGLDMFTVAIVPTSFTPTVGSTFITGQIGGEYHSSAWTTEVIPLDCNNYAGTTQRLVFTWSNDGVNPRNEPPAAIDNISLTSFLYTGTCAALLGTGVTSVSSLPYSSGAGSTCGLGNDLSYLDFWESCWVTNSTTIQLYNGEEAVWEITPTTSGNVTITVSGPSTYTTVALYEGCPVYSGCATAVQTGSCLYAGNNQTSTANIVISDICMVAGTSYYFILDTWPLPNCATYSNVSISAPVPVPPLTCDAALLGTGVFNVTLPYSASGTTCGSGNDLTIANTYTCYDPAYYTGEDQVFIFTPTVSGLVTIDLTSTGSYTGLMMYESCPIQSCPPGPEPCIGYTQRSSGDKTMVVCVEAGNEYYLVLDSWANPTCNAYSNLSISAPNPTLTNDVCSGSAFLTQGPGTWSSSTSTTYSPDTPSDVESIFCGSLENNSWYMFTAQSTTETFAFDAPTNCLFNPQGPADGLGIQAQVYSFTTNTAGCCTSFTPMSNCYNPAENIAGTVVASSLTIGQDYMLMVDGYAGDQCDFTVANWTAIGILPVQWLSFTGKAIEDSNILSWSTASERNNSHFEIERSSNAIDFEKIGEVAGNGNSSSTISYDYEDRTFSHKTQYYRLKQVDFDSEFEYSETIAIINSMEFVNLISIFPNPSKGVFQLDMFSTFQDILNIVVVDPLGNEVLSEQYNLEIGRNDFLIELSNSPKGIYFITYRTNNSDNKGADKLVVH